MIVVFICYCDRNTSFISKYIIAGGETEAHVIYCIFRQKQLEKQCYSDAAHAIKVVYISMMVFDHKLAKKNIYNINKKINSQLHIWPFPMWHMATICLSASNDQ